MGKRLIVQGDPHGCKDAVEHGLALANFDPSADELWCIGDGGDYGPDSLGVWRTYMQAGGRSILGNHDTELLTWHAVASGLLPIELPIGKGHMTEPTYEQVRNHPDVIAWLQASPLAVAFTDRRILLIHAGVLPQTDPETLLQFQTRWLDAEWVKSTANDRVLYGATWMRYLREGPEGWSAIPSYEAGLMDVFWAEVYEQGPHVLYGHETWNQPKFHKNATGIDTGCSYGRSLTTVVIPEGEPDRARWTFLSSPQPTNYRPKRKPAPAT